MARHNREEEVEEQEPEDGGKPSGRKERKATRGSGDAKSTIPGWQKARERAQGKKAEPKPKHIKMGTSVGGAILRNSGAQDKLKAPKMFTHRRPRSYNAGGSPKNG